MWWSRTNNSLRGKVIAFSLKSPRLSLSRLKSPSLSPLSPNHLVLTSRHQLLFISLTLLQRPPSTWSHLKGDKWRKRKSYLVRTFLVRWKFPQLPSQRPNENPGNINEKIPPILSVNCSPTTVAAREWSNGSRLQLSPCELSIIQHGWSSLTLPFLTWTHVYMDAKTQRQRHIMHLSWYCIYFVVLHFYQSISWLFRYPGISIPLLF